MPPSKLQAVLEYGWPESKKNTIDALALHKNALKINPNIRSEEYREHILSTLQREANDQTSLQIYNLDGLFRRRARGFGSIKKLIEMLMDFLSNDKSDAKTSQALDVEHIECHIDVFAYAFLKAGKNFDFFLPEISTLRGPFRSIYPTWKEESENLEEFERKGEGLHPKLKKSYLNLRPMIARQSARDERRTLATLLVNGPSTIGEVVEDLQLPYGLSSRIMPAFLEREILTTRTNEQGKTFYLIRNESLSSVLFCLREVMGIDLLEVLV